MIQTWYGKPVKKLSRDELLEVVDCMGEELARHRTPEAIEAHAIGSVTMMRDKNTV